MIVAGQGTAALEMLEAVPDLDVIVAPVGGGGLAAGAAIVAAGWAGARASSASRWKTMRPLRRSWPA